MLRRYSIHCFRLPIIQKHVSHRMLSIDWQTSKNSFESPSEGLQINAYSNGVLEINLAFQKTKNTLNKQFVQELGNVLDQLNDDPSIRCMIIRSLVPKIFCAGADLKERIKMPEKDVGDFVDSLRALTMNVSKLPFPTIACIEGAALGGGLELALACDIRVASSNALLGLSETALAVIPGAGGTQRLPRLIGISKAKELIFTATRLNARDAYSLGLINHIFDSQEDTINKARDIAVKIASNGPRAVQMAKLAIDKGLQLDIDSSMEIEKICYAQIIPTKDRIEGLEAFIEKRTAVYLGE